MRPVPTIAIDARLMTSQSTGDSTYWRGLLHGLSKIDPNVRIFLFSNTERPPEIPATFEWVNLRARSSRWWSLVAFPLAARKLGASVTHTQYTLSPLAKNGITTVHDVSFFIGPDWFPSRDRFILQRTIPASCRRAKLVLTVSETSRSEIHRWIPNLGDKVRVTPNACPPWVNAVLREDARAMVADQLGLAGPYLLTVGTRWPRKNMELAVAAADLLPKRFSHRLAITGKQGWGSTELGERGFATGYVTDEQLGALYSAADLYLAPSRHEGFGIPLLEAFRCGCPVVCSSGGALPEVASDAAVVMPNWDPADWSDAIGSLLDDSSKLETLRVRGRDREKDFTWERTAQLTLDAYWEAMQ